MIKIISSIISLIVLLGCSRNSESEQQVTISVTNFSISLSEITYNNQVIGTLNASSSSGALQFSILSQVPDGAVSIDAETGELIVANSTLFDYETNPIISGTIRLSQGNNSENASFQILLEDVIEGLVFEGNIELNTQQDVDDFGAENYSIVNGYLEIKYAPPVNDILDLTPLASLNQVYALLVAGIPVSSLDGLSNLQSLQTIGFAELPNLENLNGLKNLEYVGETLILRDLPSLTNLNGLEQINYLGHFLYVSENDNLLNLDGLSGLTSFNNSGAIVDIVIEFNPLLTSLEGLSNIQASSVVNKIEILANDSLENLNGLQGISGSIRDVIVSGANLTDLSGLKNITTIHNLNIIRCFSLTTLDHLTQLNSITGGFFLFKNHLLGDVDKFCEVNLMLNGFGLEEMSLLTDLSCFNGISSVESSINIYLNDNLQSLNGLESLTNVGDNLNIAGNPNLTDFCALTTLANENGVGGSFQTYNNAFNPSLEDIQNGNCSL
ncbi:cadherin repeat domain-containing protein [Aureisphaera sp. CAU 1614]|uniref:Cadherin repeat domain-containing protein n=1 Tax=Halomarinibacterium sedimenti TaxID=2857106 RepID=A0A9X1JYF6_9FLAO|nr:cadherin repeat domain-containing protein [Halomarinibacterium sedimenti]MBW2937472.1 cadherin repeat domain-containing protein [Halomarinibacterium sedimenti]